MKIGFERRLISLGMNLASFNFGGRRRAKIMSISSPAPFPKLLLLPLPSPLEKLYAEYQMSGRGKLLALVEREDEIIERKLLSLVGGRR